MTVLVAYGSKFGSTAEIAEAIADELRAAGVDVDLRDAADVKDVRDYEAVVLGSALYAFRWRPEAVRMLRRHRGELARRPLWLFHSGPLGKGTNDPQKPPRAVARLLPELGAEPPVTFAGRLEAETARGFIAKKMIEGGSGGDFRNWPAIRGWAHEIAASLSRDGQPR
jgi:menaquinone-dependent protoporphyrinogen oxidase